MMFRKLLVLALGALPLIACGDAASSGAKSLKDESPIDIGDAMNNGSEKNEEGDRVDSPDEADEAADQPDAPSMVDLEFQPA